MSLFWGIVLAGIGAYTMRASFVLLLSGVSFPDRVIRVLDHVGPAVMAALVVTTVTGSEGQLEAGPIEFLTLADGGCDAMAKRFIDRIAGGACRILCLQRSLWVTVK